MQTILKHKPVLFISLIIFSILSFIFIQEISNKIEISTNTSFSATSLNTANDIINQINNENSNKDDKKSTSNKNKESLKDKIEKAKNKLSKKNYKAAKSQYKQMTEHINKLEKYKANPLKYDNKGHLAKAPNDAIRKNIIEGRVNHLESQIKTFYDNIVRILNTVP